MSGPHVIVQLTASRRLRISVTPSTTLSNVLEQACNKFGLSAENYTLKSGKNTVDLSLPFRLSKLTSGAKVDLVKCDRSRGSSTVSVALQLVDGDGSRLIEKFPSSTTLWDVLKGFEASSIGGKLNFTERARPSMNSTGAGAGRLYYEMPVVQIMQREVSTLEGRQKSLSSLGISSGTVLLKLKFVPTEIPLEDAMAQIGGFSTTTGDSSQQALKKDQVFKEESNAVQVASDNSAETAQTVSQEADATSTPQETKQAVEDEDTVMAGGVEQPKELVDPQQTIAGPDNRQIAVFNPASGNTPEAAKRQIDESNYEMSVKQARQYQDHLKSNTINKRLLTDAQQKQKVEAETDRRRKIKEVQIRIRFPDGTAVQSSFKQEDTSENLYHFVQGLLKHPQEPFHLTLPGPQQTSVVRNNSSLIIDLGIIISTVLNFNWDSTVSYTAKSSPVLADQFRSQAIEMPIPKEPDAVEVDDDEAPHQGKSKKGSSSGAGESSSSSGGVAGKVPKWLKFGKK